jgi:uncharacterized membrane protein
LNTQNAIFIDGPAERIYELACDIERWPAILPHYESVRILEQSGDSCRKLAHMRAVRDDFPVAGARFPVQWRSVQICEASEQRITYKHLWGVAAGMWVEWSLTTDPWNRGVRVTIKHTLRYPFPILNGWFAQELVGNGFVHAIAGRTLSTIKEIVEREKEATM